MQLITIEHILNASLSKLIDYEFEGNFDCEETAIYCQGVKAFLKSDLSLLESLQLHLNQSSLLQTCLELRLKIRQGDYKVPKTLKDDLKLEKSKEPLQAELWFLMAMMYGKDKRYSEAEEFFLKSFNLFKKNHLVRKSLLAYQNAIAAKVNQSPNSSYLPEWSYLSKKAIEIHELDIAGNAQINLAREFQNVGAFEAALEVIGEAIDFLSSSTGSYQFYNAYLHKIDILIDLNRKNESLKLIDAFKICPFPELKNNVEILLLKLGKESRLDQVQPDSISWDERLHSLVEPEELRKLGKLSQKLLKELALGEKSKDELIGSIYPENISYDSKEKRLKVLLSSTRKKVTGAILFYNGKYSLDISQGSLRERII